MARGRDSPVGPVACVRGLGAACSGMSQSGLGTTIDISDQQPATFPSRLSYHHCYHHHPPGHVRLPSPSSSLSSTVNNASSSTSTPNRHHLPHHHHHHKTPHHPTLANIHLSLSSFRHGHTSLHVHARPSWERRNVGWVSRYGTRREAMLLTDRQTGCRMGKEQRYRGPRDVAFFLSPLSNRGLGRGTAFEEGEREGDGETERVRW